MRPSCSSSILVELGVNTLRTTRIERLQLWRQFQAEMRATDSRLFIVAERTEDLSPDVLHALDQLTAPDAVGNPGANLVLLGHAGIDEHLAAPALDSLRQRIRLRAELEPFTEAELQDYLRHQVARAGGHYDQIFAPGTVAALYRYSQRRRAAREHSVRERARHRRRPAPEAADGRSSSRRRPCRCSASPSPRRPRAPAAAPAPPRRPLAARRRDAVAAPRRGAITPAPPMLRRMRRADPRGAGALRRAAAAPLRRHRPRRPPPPQRRGQRRRATRRPLRAAGTARAGRRHGARSARPKPVELEFDGGATDVADVAVADFPVLTDAVERAARRAKPAAHRVRSPRRRRGERRRSAGPAPRRAPPPPPAKPAAKPASRVETAYARRARPAPKPRRPRRSRGDATLPHAARRRREAAGPPRTRRRVDPDADDELRQTQTMRAIAGAKSIDDIRSSMRRRCSATPSSISCRPRSPRPRTGPTTTTPPLRHRRRTAKRRRRRRAAEPARPREGGAAGRGRSVRSVRPRRRRAARAHRRFDASADADAQERGALKRPRRALNSSCRAARRLARRARARLAASSRTARRACARRCDSRARHTARRASALRRARARCVPSRRIVS